MTQQEHLNRIRARCVELLEIAEKRTPGAWDGVESEGDYFGDTLIGLGSAYEGWQNDVAFIASCAGAAEAGWKATIAAIDGIEEMDESTYIYNFIASNIIASWPAELL